MPAQVAHIARDPIDPLFDDELFIARLRARQTEVKRALLDQGLVSGIGNIYATRHSGGPSCPAGGSPRPWRPRPSAGCSRPSERSSAMPWVAGGTSFDSLYVNVNGESGYFSRSLAVYGREGRPCERCGRAIRRSAFMNRSSFSCPHCQPAPRVTRS